mgnify:CR=1 FL=1
MTVHVQEVLRSGAESLASLTEKYHIKTKRHGKHPNLIHFKYDQINSLMSEPLVQQCRGLILDEADGWNVVARPFDKFFNLGEGGAAEIDWKTSRPLEKLDGSLMVVYWYKDEWHVATSGTPDGNGRVRQMAGPFSTQTFRELFWKTFSHCGYSQLHLDARYTWMFELMTPENRVIIPHVTSRLVLIGLRHLDTGEEVDVLRHFALDRFEVVKSFNYDSPEALEQSFETMDGLQQEGYVVVDAQFRRVKVKHPRYVLYHQMVGSLTKKRVLDAVRQGEAPEVLTYFPSWKTEFEEMHGRYEILLDEVAAEYGRICSISSQKDFAREAQKTTCSAAMFSIRAKKVGSFREFFGAMRIDALAEMLGVEETVGA